MKDTSSLAAMMAERDRLNAEIERTVTEQRRQWNEKLEDRQDDLLVWLKQKAIEYETSTRKNTVTWDIGHGALRVFFTRAEDGYDGDLSATSGSEETLRLEWNHVPDAARFFDIVAALLGETP